MRGRVPDVDRLMKVARRHGVEVVEDCAHTLGARWNSRADSRSGSGSGSGSGSRGNGSGGGDCGGGRHLGTFGAVGCWSFQTNKAVNSGEGGIVTTHRQDLAAYMTVATGSYGHFGLNGLSGDNDYIEQIYPTVPNM